MTIAERFKNNKGSQGMQEVVFNIWSLYVWGQIDQIDKKTEKTGALIACFAQRSKIVVESSGT